MANALCMENAENLVEVRDLVVKFRTDEGIVSAVNSVSYDIPIGKTMGVVGESGCGKSVTSNAIMRILPENGWIASGSILFNSRLGVFDIARLPDKDKRLVQLHGREMAMIFQEPMTSFCPVYTIGNQIIEAIKLHTDLPKSEWRNRAIDLLRKVKIAKPEQRVDEYPYQLSGGMRQRAMIAMALASNPRLLVADEPTTSLDVTVQAQVLGLLEDLQQEYNISYLFIAHDLSAVKHISDRIVVMYVGKVVEICETEELYSRPMHPYTEALLGSVPKLIADKSVRKATLEGEVPDPSRPPEGCFFHPRCRYATEECKKCDMKLIPVDPNDPMGHRTTCIRYKELSLKGV